MGCAQVSFHTVQALMDAKRELGPAVRRNRAREATTTAYAAFESEGRAGAPRLQVLSTYCMCVSRCLIKADLDAHDLCDAAPGASCKSKRASSRDKQEGQAVLHGHVEGHTKSASDPQGANL